MSNSDRGAYTPPTDPPLSFDARQPVRGRSPAPMMLIVSALVLVVLVGAIFVFYRSGLTQSAGAPPVVGTPVGQIKGAAPATAQPTDPAQGLQIYQQSEGAAAPTAPNFTPPPETPQTRAAASPPPSAPVTTTATPPAAAVPVVALPLAKGQLKPPLVATAPAPTAAKPAVVAAKPPAAPPIVAAAKPAVATPPKPTAVASGVAAVQIGAFSSQALADKGWNDAAKLAPGAAAGKGKKVEAIQKDGATLYRTQVTGFASRADAQAFCAKLQAAGKSCFVK